MIRFFIPILFISLIACYTRNEACLDTIASNYDVTADDDCLDCCEYPKLQLLISQIAGDSIFEFRDTFINDLNQKYIIEDIRFYLSDFSLYQSDSSFSIREKISTDDNLITIPNDMKIIRATSVLKSEIDIGSIRKYGKFDCLRFNLGLSEIMTSSTFVNLPSNHVLLKANKLQDTLNNIAYFTMKFKRKEPKELGDTLSKNLIVKQRPNFPFFKRDTIIMTNKGTNIIYPIKVDYKVLLKDLDLNLNPDSLSSLIFKNLKNMIIVR